MVGLVGQVLGVAGGVRLADGRNEAFWTKLGVCAPTVGETLGALAMADDDGESAGTVAGMGAVLQVGLTIRTELVCQRAGAITSIVSRRIQRHGEPHSQEAQLRRIARTGC